MHCITEIYSCKIKYSFNYESCNRMKQSKTLNENGSKITVEHKLQINIRIMLYETSQYIQIDQILVYKEQK